MFKPQPLYIKAASADLVDYNERLQRSVRAAVNSAIEDEAEQQPYFAGHGIIKGTCGHQIRRCMCPQHQKEINVGIRCRTCEQADDVKKSASVQPISVAAPAKWVPGNMSDDIWSSLKKWEGGYTNDSGGHTNYGIAESSGLVNGKSEAQALTKDKARELWQDNFYHKSGAHFKDPRLALVSTHIAGNAGPGYFAKSLQRNLNKLSQDNQNMKPLAEDGILGSGTRSRIGSVDPNALMTGLVDDLGSHHKKLIAANPSKYGPYQKGWGIRVDYLRGYADKPAQPMVVKPQVARPTAPQPTPVSQNASGSINKSGGVSRLGWIPN